MRGGDRRHRRKRAGHADTANRRARRAGPARARLRLRRAVSRPRALRRGAFGGEVVRYEALAEDQVYVSRANDRDAKVPSYMGGKFPLSTYLAERVRKLLDDKPAWRGLPDQVHDWLSLQRGFSLVPGVRELL